MNLGKVPAENIQTALESLASTEAATDCAPTVSMNAKRQ